MPKKFFKKKQNTGSPKGLTPTIMKVFEKNLGVEFTHKDICTRIDANNPALRQQVFDTLTQLAKRNIIKQTILPYIADIWLLLILTPVKLPVFQISEK